MVQEADTVNGIKSSQSGKVERFQVSLEERYVCYTQDALDEVCFLDVVIPALDGNDFLHAWMLGELKGPRSLAGAQLQMRRGLGTSRKKSAGLTSWSWFRPEP